MYQDAASVWAYRENIVQRGYVTLTAMKSALIMKPEQSLVSLGKRYSEVTEHVMAFISLRPSTLRKGVLDPMRESTVSL